MKQIHAVVRGRVQGVGFRAGAAEQARRLGLSGWVRNRLDGTVEVLAAGDDAAVDQLAAWLKQGPRGAHVTALDIHPPPPSLADALTELGFAQRSRRGKFKEPSQGSCPNEQSIGFEIR